MEYNKEEFLDKLSRAYEMEEEMAGILLDLTRKNILTYELSKDKKKRVLGVLLGIKNDTIRHKRIVSDILRHFSKE